MAIDIKELIRDTLQTEEVRKAVEITGGDHAEKLIAQRIRDAQDDIIASLQPFAEEAEKAESLWSERWKARKRAQQAPAFIPIATSLSKYIGGVLALALLAFAVHLTFSFSQALSLWWNAFDNIAIRPNPRTWTFAATVILYAALIPPALLIWWRLALLRRTRAAELVYPTTDVWIAYEGKTKELKQNAQAMAQSYARQAINELGADLRQGVLLVDTPPPSPDLRVTTGSGPSQVYSSNYDIIRGERQTVLEFITRLPGSSIGIAGPRGAGKSSLLLALCGTTAAASPRHKTLSVYTSAPVEYEGRDFLLHLFGSLCLEILRDTNTPLAYSDDDGIEWKKSQNRLRAILPQVALFVAATAAAFGALAATLAAVSGSFRPAQTPTVVWGAPPPNVITALVETIAKPAATTLGQVTLSCLALLLALGIYLVLTRVRTPRAISSVLFALSHRKQMGGIARALRVRRHFENDHFEPDRIRVLAQDCLSKLRDIRFQQSYSVGWSGSFKAPAGFDLGHTRAMSLAERQRSMPELVQEFRSFAQKLAPIYAPIIIAIDELDKIRSAAKAEDLLNDIKAIFGIPGVFYLVSVSDNALSAFERRSFGVRDAFDSAFDEIVSVGYLDLASARLLLKRRLIHFPDPFICACQVLSGGLPRDLLRTARAMLQHARQTPGIDVPTVMRDFLTDELRRKVRATQILVRDCMVEPNATLFLHQLDQVLASRLEELDSPHLLRRQPAVETPTDADTADLRRLETLRIDLRAYISWVHRTLMDFKSLDWRSDNVDERISELTRLKQQLDIRPALVAAALHAPNVFGPDPEEDG